MVRGTEWMPCYICQVVEPIKASYNAWRERTRRTQDLPNRRTEVNRREPHLRRPEAAVSSAPERSREQRTQNCPLNLTTRRSGNFDGSKFRGQSAQTAVGWSEPCGRRGRRHNDITTFQAQLGRRRVTDTVRWRERGVGRELLKFWFHELKKQVRRKEYGWRWERG